MPSFLILFAFLFLHFSVCLSFLSSPCFCRRKIDGSFCLRPRCYIRLFPLFFPSVADDEGRKTADRGKKVKQFLFFSYLRREHTCSSSASDGWLTSLPGWKTRRPHEGKKDGGKWMAVEMIPANAPENDFLPSREAARSIRYLSLPHSLGSTCVTLQEKMPRSSECRRHEKS